LPTMFVPLVAVCSVPGKATFGRDAAAPDTRLPAARLNPRFAKPANDPAEVMPVGSGDLSAMVRFDGKDGRLHLHFSKTDWFANARGKSWGENVISPGHVAMALPGLDPKSITAFSQQMDLARGALTVNFTTPTGSVAIEVFGVMNSNALVVCVTDSRTNHYGMLNCDLGAIYCAGNVDCAGGSVDHNFIHDPASWWGQFGIYTDNGSGNALIHHNVFWGGDMENCIFRNGGRWPNKIYNNTCVNGKLQMNGTTGEDDVRNNIFRNWGGTKGSNNVYSNTDPMFANATVRDYRLRPASPAIDAGTVISPYTDGFHGSAPDLGAFESGGDDWTAGASLTK
jgi:hypothetical protein